MPVGVPPSLRTGRSSPPGIRRSIPGAPRSGDAARGARGVSARSLTAIIGAGRMGRGIAAAMEGGGHAVRLLGRDRRPDATRGVELVLLAVPDDAVEPVAAELARARAIEAEQVVLH